MGRVGLQVAEELQQQVIGPIAAWLARRRRCPGKRLFLNCQRRFDMVLGRLGPFMPEQVPVDVPGGPCQPSDDVMACPKGLWLCRHLALGGPCLQVEKAKEAELATGDLAKRLLAGDLFRCNAQASKGALQGAVQRGVARWWSHR